MNLHFLYLLTHETKVDRNPTVNGLVMVISVAAIVLTGYSLLVVIAQQRKQRKSASTVTK
ncbi:MAG: hypothetical protein RL438_1289 [Actinomycetota bacterium]|jgi:hypothetical protein